jgi:hypothetical protein
MRISRLLRAAAAAGVAAMAFVANPAASATALTYTVTVDPFVVGSDAGTVDVTNITITNPNTYAVEITSITPSFIAHNDLGGGASPAMRTTRSRRPISTMTPQALEATAL